MRLDHEITVEAPASTVWDIYRDVEHWPEWTASITSAQYVEGDGIEVGGRVRISQPKLATATWDVSNVEPGRSWTWEAKVPGFRTVAVHDVEPVDGTTTRVHSSIVQTGPVGELFGRLYARLTRKYLTMEADGLKARSEARASA